MAGESISAIDSIGLGLYDPMMSMMAGGYGGMGLGMNSMMGAYSPYMMGGMGMYSPAFMGQMIDAQTDMMRKMYGAQESLEKQKLEHSTEMHALSHKADVINMEALERATFLKEMQEADVQNAVRDLYDSVRRGDQDDVCMRYDALKETLTRKYGDYYLSHDGKKNLGQKLNYHISLLYSQMGTAWNGGRPVDLRSDVMAYGESPFMNGFKTSFLGNKGHNQFYSEQTLNYMFGDRINDPGNKARARKAGGYAEKGVEAVVLAPAAGFAAGVGATAIAKTLLPDALTRWMKAGKIGKAFAWLALVGDVFWQFTRS